MDSTTIFKDLKTRGCITLKIDGYLTTCWTHDALFVEYAHRSGRRNRIVRLRQIVSKKEVLFEGFFHFVIFFFLLRNGIICILF